MSVEDRLHTGVYRERLTSLRDAALNARDIIGDQVYDERRNPTTAELDTLGQLLDKANGYQKLIDKFFLPSPRPREEEEVLY